MILRQARSNLGTFTRTPLGIRGTNAFVLKSDGFSSADMTAGFVPIQAKACISNRTDQPTMGTQVGLISTDTYAHNPTSLIDVTLSKGTLSRFGRARLGMTFAIPSTLASSYTINFSSFSGMSGADIYSCNADYSSLYGFSTTKAAWDWETHLDNNISTNVNTSTLSLSPSSFAPFLGQNMSLVFVTQGDAAGVYPGSDVTIQLAINVTLTVGF